MSHRPSCRAGEYVSNPNWWVVGGLIIDTVGAIGVLAPEMAQLRRYLSVVTPELRKIYLAGRRLIQSSQPERKIESDELVSEFRNVWPAIKSNLLLQESPDRISEAEWVQNVAHNRTGQLAGETLKVSDTSGDLIVELAGSEIEAASRSFRDSRFRRWGSVLLVLGFALQLVGQFVP